MTLQNNYSIIPKPLSIQYRPGFFRCSGLPKIKEASGFQNEAALFSWQLRQTWGDETCDCGVIRLVKTKSQPEENSFRADEFYKLEILPDEIIISAAAGAGAYRGLQVLRQLFLSGISVGEAGCAGRSGITGEAGSAFSISCGLIEDRPRFSWRGFMLDTSRHFYSAGFIKKLLDALSLQHINIFHWHLTDDQGWRLPVDKYPLLTEIGSKRREHRLGDEFYGGHYTKEEIRDIVAFAAARHIEVVPEVDLPGHASAILASYPGLGCTGGPYRVEDRFGIFEDVLCAGNDDIFPLAEAVFDSLAELFPSRYVHIGGDEVRFNRWAKCPRCRRRLEELGLAKAPQLQSWITSRLARMLKERGKTAIGWEEVLENTEKFPLPEDVVIQSWRGEEGGNRATAQGHRIIMSPENHGCYLDRRHVDKPEEPGRLSVGTITQAFNMNPVTEKMDAASTSLVLGGQGNLWSEVIYAGKIAEYMIFPRICAIAEAVWSEKESGISKEDGLEDFAKRLEVHQLRLDKLGLLQYRGALE